MTDLVYVKKDEATTDSITVARHFGKNHRHVLRKIEQIVARSSAPNGAQCFTQTQYVDASGKRNRMYTMNRDGFMFLVMGFTGKKADEWKWNFIEAFNQMEQYIREHAVEKALRRNMTDAIRDSGENERMHGFAYSQYTDLIYRKVTGRSAKQLRQELGLKKADSLKEHLTPAQVEVIGYLEDMIRDLVAMGMIYPAIKEMVGAVAVSRYSIA